jgi:light-regulated signal transduction histidine kinase (bacteriophytochrome)
MFADQGLTEYTAAGGDGIPRMYFVERIPESGWIAYVGVPTAAVDAVRQRVLLTGLTLGTLGFLLVTAIIIMLARRLTIPIRALASTARAIREGGTSVRAPLAGPREVVEVAREFNALVETRDRQTDELLRSNAELERFAHVAAHDLQEPIRTVVAYSQFLERRMAEVIDDDDREILDFIVGGAKRMHELVRDLLAYSRLTGADTPFTSVDMLGVVHEAIGDLDAAIRDSGAEIEVDESSLPAVLGARVQLLELMRNLIANAIRFRRPGEKLRIRIGTTEIHGEPVFAVADNGIGIERQYWGQIFVVFKRLHGNDFPGTGIGLATCKRIVERHGGRIWVDSVPGQGSTFFFTLND